MSMKNKNSNTLVFKGGHMETELSEPDSYHKNLKQLNCTMALLYTSLILL